MIKIKNEITKNFILYSVLLIITTLLFYLVQPVNSTKVVYIPKGSINHIIHHLSKSGFNVNKIDSLIVRFIGKPQSGWIEVGANKLSRFDFLYKLTTAKAAMEPVTLIPGQTKELFFYEISQKFGLDLKTLLVEYGKQTTYKDGVILAETYFIPKGIGERHLIAHLITMSEKRHEELAKKIFTEFDKAKWYNYLIVASIIQKEAANDEEMPLVSSVIYNRLQKGMKLQMDGTLNYGIYSNQKVTPRRIKEDTSRYNTYKYKGLPPDPVGSVSLNAIKAAINPARTDYLYFVRGANGTHLFAKTYAQHLKNIRR
jgi:UPF0755 protein